MAESAALLVDDVLHGYPIRQWVLSLPIPLRLLLARYPSELGKNRGQVTCLRILLDRRLFYR